MSCLVYIFIETERYKMFLRNRVITRFNLEEKEDSYCYKTIRSFSALVLKGGIYLLPVILLSLVSQITIHSHKLVYFGNRSLLEINLLVAFIIPWLSQIVCLPIFVGLGDDIYKFGNSIISNRLMARIPWLLILSMGLICFISGTLILHYKWSLIAALVFTGLSILHILAIQLMIYSSIQKQWLSWNCCWISYAILTLFADKYWFLPPLGPIIIMGAIIINKLSHWSKPIWEFATFRGLLNGLFLGMILWGDKFLLFLTSKEPLKIDPLFFLSMLPALFVSTYYIVKVAPKIETLLAGTMRGISSAKISVFLTRKEKCYAGFYHGFLEVIFMGILFTIIVGFVIHSNRYSFLMLLNSYLLSVETILLNSLLILKRQRIFNIFCVSYLLFLIVLILMGVSSFAIVGSVCLGSLLVAPALIYASLQEWRDPYFYVLWKKHEL